MNYQEAINIWFEFYREKVGLNYVMTNKEGANLKRLIKHFESKEEFKTFLLSIKDDWVLERLTISVVLSKINILRQQQIAKPKPEQVYISGVKPKSPKQMIEEELIRQAYERLKNNKEGKA